VQLAKEEVRLEISRNNELFEAFVDHPGREREGRRDRGRRSDGYRVGFDFVLKVPASASLYLRTINEGEIRVQDVAGDFDVNNINGGIEIIETAGSGRAYALNGNLKVLFRSNPTRDCYFGSLNGKVDLFFQPALAADLRLKTFNGEIYTDFDVTSLPASPFKQERRNGRYVYRASEFFGVRIGQGGPELKIENFNGDICIHERKQ